MNIFTDPTTVTHGIQLAVAPVFLLTAVSGMIGSVANRLSRIIDRARILEERLKTPQEPEFVNQAHLELSMLRKRGHLANGAIGLLTLCAFLIGLTIVILFLDETTAFEIDRLAIVSFLSGVACFMLALGCFMAETMLATRILNFGRPKRNVD
jgi:Protein of unknown function (DUF2721)